MGTRQLTKQEYLYGIDAEVEEIPAELIMRRIATLEDHLTGLIEVHYFNRDDVRIEAIHSAIQFWRDANAH